MLAFVSDRIGRLHSLQSLPLPGYSRCASCARCVGHVSGARGQTCGGFPTLHAPSSPSSCAGVRKSVMQQPHALAATTDAGRARNITFFLTQGIFKSAVLTIERDGHDKPRDRSRPRRSAPSGAGRHHRGRALDHRSGRDVVPPHAPVRHTAQAGLEATRFGDVRVRTDSPRQGSGRAATGGVGVQVHPVPVEGQRAQLPRHATGERGQVHHRISELGHRCGPHRSGAAQGDTGAGRPPDPVGPALRGGQPGALPLRRVRRPAAAGRGRTDGVVHRGP